MVDEVLRKAVGMARTVYLATHRDVDAADGRRCLLERHLQGMEVSQSEMEELTCSGLAYLDRLPQGRMMKRIELLIERIAAGSARPDWTLFALSSLLSATLVLAMQSLQR
jgi:hypothetical protein